MYTELSLVGANLQKMSVPSSLCHFYDLYLLLSFPCKIDLKIYPVCILVSVVILWLFLKPLLSNGFASPLSEACRGVCKEALSHQLLAPHLPYLLWAQHLNFLAPHQKILCHQKRQNDLFCYFKTFEVSQFGRGGS